jgi:hypothetical protein
MSNPSTFDEVADALYTRPPSEFVAARRAAVDRARREGDRALAERIGALRRPTAAAHALNLFARAQPEQVEQLRALGQGLRDAQTRLQGSRLRELAAQRNALVTALAEQTRRVAAEAGQAVGEQAAADIDQTLRAILADERAAEEFAAGRLTHALTPGTVLPDLPDLALTDLPRSAAPRVRPAAAPKTEERRREEARRKRLAEAEEVLRALETEQRDATAVVRHLRTEADHAAEQQGAAAEEVRRAEQELARAREALVAAEKRRAEDDAEAAAAERRSAKAQRRLDEQRASVERLREA